MKAFKFKTRRFNQLSMAARNASTEKTELAGISCRLSKKRSPRSPNTSRSARARFVGAPFGDFLLTSRIGVFLR